ncbi:ComEC/Rec2 family competence protein, partial [Promineifilum sp.]|uniref:ComEC/Rec2 family competence protein n=1 Tax=Promineifilum sp. TaxID=2664178 RepID=UPI0035AF28DE
MIIIGLLDRLTWAFLPRRPATLVIILLLALYAVLVGAAPSVVRATVMGKLSPMSSSSRSSRWLTPPLTA